MLTETVKKGQQEFELLKDLPFNKAGEVKNAKDWCVIIGIKHVHYYAKQYKNVDPYYHCILDMKEFFKPVVSNSIIEQGTILLDYFVGNDEEGWVGIQKQGNSTFSDIEKEIMEKVLNLLQKKGKAYTERILSFGALDNYDSYLLDIFKAFAVKYNPNIPDLEAELNNLIWEFINQRRK